MKGKEALVICGEKKKEGIVVRDLETGDVLLHIPTCASPPNGLLCLHNCFLVASQLRTDRSFGCGTIFFWPLNKHKAPQISNPMEDIKPIASSKDGVFFVGGTPSGNACIWEVASGRLLKNWHAHRSPLSWLTFSHDDSFLISGSEDGTISIWSMISLLNNADLQSCASLHPFHIWSEHGSSITGLLSVSSGSGPGLISSSLDATCKVWDIVSGTLLQSHVFSVAITAVTTDPGEQLLFAGREDGKVYVNVLHLGLQEDPITISEEESGVLHEHKGSITALSFNLEGSCLISASEDHTVCLWDVVSWQVIRRFTHGEGQITNLLVIPQSSLSLTQDHENCSRSCISLLDKIPHSDNAYEGTLTLLPGSNSHSTHPFLPSSQSYSLLNKEIFDSEYGRTPEAIQMQIDMSIENRMWILNTMEHMNFINGYFQSRFIDMMQYRLSGAGRSRQRGKNDNLEDN